MSFQSVLFTSFQKHFKIFTLKKIFLTKAYVYNKLTLKNISNRNKFNNMCYIVYYKLLIVKLKKCYKQTGQFHLMELSIKPLCNFCFTPEFIKFISLVSVEF